MRLLDIMTTIFEYKYFETIIIAVGIFLAVLFLIVLFLGIKDSKKKEIKKEIIKLEPEEITFDEPKEELIINEEVTLEMPTITKNLEDFKKTLEEEIKNEQITSNVEVEKTEDKSLCDSTKPFKILDVNEIEDTVIMETVSVETPAPQEETIEKIEVLEEEPKEETRIEIEEDSIVQVQKLDIPMLAPDEDDELLFKTMTALRLPQDI